MKHLKTFESYREDNTVGNKKFGTVLNEELIPGYANQPVMPQIALAVLFGLWYVTADLTSSDSKIIKGFKNISQWISDKRIEYTIGKEIKKLNKMAEDYFEKEGKIVTIENKEKIDNLFKRSSSSIKDGSESNKFYELRYQIFKIYWTDFVKKNRNNLNDFKNLEQDQVYKLLIGIIYYKIGIDKDLKSQSNEKIVKDLEKFIKYVLDKGSILNVS